jgi:hypothetical protein
MRNKNTKKKEDNTILLLLAAGAAYWYFFMRKKPGVQVTQPVEPSRPTTMLTQPRIETDSATIVDQIRDFSQPDTNIYLPVTQPVEPMQPIGPGGPSGGGAPLEFDGGGKFAFDADIYQNYYVQQLGSVKRPGVPYTI